MFREWLGDDQTIDLQQWGQCIGIRQACLATLPQVRMTIYLITLDGRQVPQEILRIVLDKGALALHLVPPASLDASFQGNDLAGLAAKLSATLPSDPPLLCTIVLSHRAASELALSLMAEPKRAATFRTRLAAGHGEHWTVHGANPLAQRLTVSALTRDWRKHVQDLARQMEGMTIMWHRDGSPATRGGTRFTNGQFRLLAPEELVGVPDAIWVDERLIGNVMIALARMLARPQTRSAFGLRLALVRNLLRGFVRRGGRALQPRWLLFALGYAFPRRQIHPAAAPEPPQRTETKLALYARLDGPAPDQESAHSESPLDLLIEVLSSRPQVRASIGWTRAMLDQLIKEKPRSLDVYRSGVEQGQLESICADCPRPFPLCTSSHMIRAQVTAWENAANRAGPIVATGFAPRGGTLSPGWSTALSDSDCQFLALAEAQIRHIHPRFDPTRPITSEGWPVVGTHRELSQALKLELESNVLDSYLQSISADYGGGTLAVTVRVADTSDAERLSRFLDHALAQGFSFVPLSTLASTRSQGILDASPHSFGLEPWVSDETNRTLNALTDQIWYHSCVPQDQWHDDRQETLVQLAEHSLIECRERAQDSLVHRRPLPKLPGDAVGLVRVFDPSGLEGRASLLQVQVPNTDAPPGSFAFVDKGVSIPSQFITHQDGMDHFVLDIDMGSDHIKDLVILSSHTRPTMDGLDITTSRLCNPWLAVLLDQRGQVTSIRYQGQERLYSPSNTIRGHLLQTDYWLRPEREQADITVAESGPLRGTITAYQTLGDSIKLTRHIRMALSSPLIEFITEMEYAGPHTFSGALTVGLFSLVGKQASWAMPLQAGRASQAAYETGPLLFAAEDAIDVHTGQLGMRYLAHQPSTRTYLYSAVAAPTAEGIELGLIASAPGRVPDPRRLSVQSGLGFPGHTYSGHYVYRYALLPLGFDTQTHTTAYNSPLVWAFCPIEIP